MEILLLLLLFPLIWPFVAKKIWGHEITWPELAINVVGVVLIVVAVWYGGRYSAMADTEIWNGEVLTKRIEDGYYQTSTCTSTNKDGVCTSRTYTDHYTRDWTVKGNFGGSIDTIYHKSRESGSRSRRNAFPEPARYTAAIIGEPAAIEKSYVNYVQAVPDSLFSARDIPEGTYVPTYPRVYDYYRMNRVIGDDIFTTIDFRQDLNDRLNNGLKWLGSQAQVNIIVVLTSNPDPTFRYTVENAWLGGEKNDAVIFIGTENGGLDEDGNLIPKIMWADVMTFARNTGNESFHVTLRDALLALGHLDSEKVSDLILKTVDNKFDRVKMDEFKYLENRIQPADWVIWVAVGFSILGTLLLSWIMSVVDIDSNGIRLSNSRRNYSKYNRRNFR